jgi:hypothetical protein
VSGERLSSKRGSQDVRQNNGFKGAESRFAVSGEIFRNGAADALHNGGIQVCKWATEPRRKYLPDTAFSAAHKTCKADNHSVRIK